MADISLTTRMKTLIDLRTDKRGKFAQLEELTGLPSESWKSFYYGKQRPNPDMIEAIGRTWPEYAFWLITGLEDHEYGHVAPGDHGFPSRTSEQPNTAAYFAAIRDYRKEAEKAGRYWFESEVDESLDFPLDDFLLRSVHLLGLPEEVISDLLNAQRQLSKTQKLRRAEILLNSEMPHISYEETGSLGTTIKNLLDSVTGISDERKKLLEEKLHAELERLKRHQEITAKLNKPQE
jgi:hypothetical protein